VKDSWTKISISDTGIGISDNEVEKIFHPFFTSKETGSGLGLAVCNQIISIHGGHIKLRRQIPQGVVFDIYLPVVKQ
jgi:two-component system, sporulation sensor kinase D